MFLATTAVEEFWGQNCDLLFLGEWCKRYQRRNVWEAIPHQTVPFRWGDASSIDTALSGIRRAYDQVWQQLPTALNTVHHLDKPPLYWHRLLGNWLIHFIHVVFERHEVIERALREHRIGATLLLDRRHWITVAHHAEHCQRIIRDEFNLQLYSEILDLLRPGFPSRTLSEPLQQTVTYRNSGSRIQQLAARLTRFVTRVLSRDKAVTLADGYFSYDITSKMAQLLMKNFGRLVVDDFVYPIDVAWKIDPGLRATLDLGQPGDGFGRILVELVRRHIPALFLEGFASFREQVLAARIPRTKVLVTAVGMHFNNVLKLSVAEADAATTVCTVQHGGGYGTDREYVQEWFERSASDLYFSWGWGEEASCRNLPSPKLGGTRGESFPREVLLVLSGDPRYLYRFQYRPSGPAVLDNIRRTIGFVRLLNERNIPVRIRFYPSMGDEWCAKERFEESGVRFEIDRTPAFSESLRCARLLVCDFLTTTYLEGLALDVPTILFLEPETHRFRPAAEPWFKDLERVGILHWSPETAVERVSTVFDDPGAWWKAPDTKHVTDGFCRRYARSDPQWIDTWTKEFERILSDRTSNRKDQS